MASVVVISSIFYMIGMRDHIDTTGSQVIVYIFDALVIAYFLAFPIVCLVYHPRIKCRFRMCRSTIADRPNQSNNSPVISNSSAHLVAYRRNNANGIVHPQNLNVETTI
jgi:hypothetical protein